MAEQDWTRSGVDEVDRAAWNPVVLAASAFGLGLVTGLFLKGAVGAIQERAQARRWHRDYERTVTYGENLPDSLARREPLPEAGQPRYGGTGAFGVHPAAADSAPAGEKTTRGRGEAG